MRSVSKQVDYFFETDSAAKCLLSSVLTYRAFPFTCGKTDRRNSTHFYPSRGFQKKFYQTAEPKCYLGRSSLAQFS